MSWVRRHRSTLVATVFGVATALLLGGQISRGFDYDEGVSVVTTIGRGSALVPLTESTVFNNHPLFAVGQSIWWDLGGDGEAPQRLLPIVYGAVAVAVLVGWLARRLGVLPAASAGLVLMLNPMFVNESRNVRGYSLALLAVVVGTVTLLEYVRREMDAPGSASAWFLMGHAVAVVVGMGTHLFSGVPLGAVGIGSLLVLRRFDLRLFFTWAVAGLLTLAVYLPTLDELRSTTEARGSRYLPWFGRFTSWEVLGRDRLTATVVASVAALGLMALLGRHITTRRQVAVAAFSVAALVIAQGLLFWKVLQPFDLYPRFFLSSIPLIAIAVAIGVRRLPWLALVVATAMVFTWGNVADARSSSSSVREVAAVVRSANGLGLDTSAVGGLPMRAYGAASVELRPGRPDTVARLEDCDVFVRIGGWGLPLLEPARAHFAHESRIGNFEVFSKLPLEQITA